MGSGNLYKYHFLSSETPDDLLLQNGYPIKINCRNSQKGTMIGFHGKKKTDLEQCFDDYVIDPLSYFNGKSKNMTKTEFVKITMKEGSNDSNGFIPVQE